MCPTLPNKILQDLSSKIPPQNKFVDIAATARSGGGQKAIFVKKNAFFRQKMTFFQKVHFIQICSVTQNTVFQYVKIIFLLSQKKLIFFTELNLIISYSYIEQQL